MKPLNLGSERCAQMAEHSHRSRDSSCANKRLQIQMREGEGDAFRATNPTIRPPPRKLYVRIQNTQCAAPLSFSLLYTGDFIYHRYYILNLNDANLLYRTDSEI